MDHEKPQAVFQQIFEYGGEQSQLSDVEPTQVEERRERRGESVWQVVLFLSSISVRSYIW